MKASDGVQGRSAPHPGAVVLVAHVRESGHAAAAAASDGGVDATVHAEGGVVEEQAGHPDRRARGERGGEESGRAAVRVAA